MTTLALIDTAIEHLRGHVPGLMAVYLFGSAASGGQHAGSDIDLAVLGASPLDPVARFELAGNLAALLRRDVDLVDLLAASTVLRAQIVVHGRLVYEGDATRRMAFEMRVLSAYALLNEERAGILEDARQRGRIHD
jgi:uncharacterized protein